MLEKPFSVAGKGVPKTRLIFITPDGISHKMSSWILKTLNLIYEPVGFIGRKIIRQMMSIGDEL